MHHQPSRTNRRALALSPTWARGLSVVSIGALWSWFLLRFSLQDNPNGIAGVVGSVALLGGGASLTLLATQDLHLAYAGDHETDEREFALRNRAHRVALHYAL